MPIIEELLTTRDLERITGRAKHSFDKDRLTGTGPRYIKVGRLVRYRWSDVEEWLQQNTRTSTSDTGADTAPPPLAAHPRS